METLKSYLEPLLKECNRVLDCMSKEYPSSPNYTAMVKNFLNLDSVVDSIGLDEWRVNFKKSQDGVKAEVKQEQEPVVTETVTTVISTGTGAASFSTVDNGSVSEPVGEPEPEPVAEPVKKKKKLTKEDVRAILQAKSESGVLIQPIISQFVPEGKKVALSSIKASDYEALVEAVNNAG